MTCHRGLVMTSRSFISQSLRFRVCVCVILIPKRVQLSEFASQFPRTTTETYSMAQPTSSRVCPSWKACISQTEGRLFFWLFFVVLFFWFVWFFKFFFFFCFCFLRGRDRIGNHCLKTNCSHLFDNESLLESLERGLLEQGNRTRTNVK